MSRDRMLIGPWFCRLDAEGRLIARGIGPCIIACTGWDRVSLMIAPQDGAWTTAIVAIRRTLDPSIGAEHEFTPPIEFKGGGGVYDIDCAGLGYIVPVVTRAESSGTTAALYALLSRSACHACCVSE